MSVRNNKQSISLCCSIFLMLNQVHQAFKISRNLRHETKTSHYCVLGETQDAVSSFRGK